jgi:molybdenum cofactor cytidylyltransferase
MTETATGVVALVMAAGHGRRFRAECNQDKLLSELDTSDFSGPVLAHVLRGLAGRVERILVVVRQDNHPLRRILDQELAWTGCCQHRVGEGGMGDSLASGAAQLDPTAGYLIVLGDMPFVSSTTIERVSAAIRPDSLVVPVYRGRPGHPRGVGRDFRAALLAAGGEAGAAALFRSGLVTPVEVDDPGILQDIDQPADLQAGVMDGTIVAPRES